MKLRESLDSGAHVTTKQILNCFAKTQLSDPFYLEVRWNTHIYTNTQLPSYREKVRALT